MRIRKSDAGGSSYSRSGSRRMRFSNVKPPSNVSSGSNSKPARLSQFASPSINLNNMSSSSEDIKIDDGKKKSCPMKKSPMRKESSNLSDKMKKSPLKKLAQFNDTSKRSRDDMEIEKKSPLKEIEEEEMNLPSFVMDMNAEDSIASRSLHQMSHVSSG